MIRIAALLHRGLCSPPMTAPFHAKPRQRPFQASSQRIGLVPLRRYRAEERVMSSRFSCGFIVSISLVRAVSIWVFGGGGGFIFFPRSCAAQSAPSAPCRSEWENPVTNVKTSSEMLSFKTRPMVGFVKPGVWTWRPVTGHRASELLVAGQVEGDVRFKALVALQPWNRSRNVIWPVGGSVGETQRRYRTCAAAFRMQLRACNEYMVPAQGSRSYSSRA